MNFISNRARFLLGIILLTLPIIIHKTILQMAIDAISKKRLSLKNGYMMRGIWTKYPMPFKFQVYLFNVTNPENIKKGDKPILEEVGPFIYEEWQEKVDQIDHEEDDTVSSSFKRTFYYNEKASNGNSPEDEIVIPHLFILGLVNLVKREKPASLILISSAINSILRNPESLFIKAKVREILFDGLIIDCNVSDFAGVSVCREIEQNYKQLHLNLVAKNVYSASFFGIVNGTASTQRMRINRGTKVLKNLGTVMEYDNKKNLSMWNDTYCDAFGNSSDATIFHPYFDAKGRDPLLVISTDLCRKITMHHNSVLYKRRGIKFLRYEADLGIYPEDNKDEKCYCFPRDNCLKNGIYDVYKCAGVPVVISNPHFYNADLEYLNSVVGLKPDKDKHLTILDVDPVTGVPLLVHTRPQFNFFIEKTPDFSMMANFPNALLPVLWIDSVLNLPKSLMDEVISGNRLVTLSKIVGFVLQSFVIIGLGITAFAVFKSFTDKNAKAVQAITNDN